MNLIWIKNLGILCAYRILSSLLDRLTDYFVDEFIKYIHYLSFQKKIELLRKLKLKIVRLKKKIITLSEQNSHLKYNAEKNHSKIADLEKDNKNYRGENIQLRSENNKLKEQKENRVDFLGSVSSITSYNDTKVISSNNALKVGSSFEITPFCLETTHSFVTPGVLSFSDISSVTSATIFPASTLGAFNVSAN